MVAQFDKNKTCPTIFELQYRIYFYYKITHSSENFILMKHHIYKTILLIKSTLLLLMLKHLGLLSLYIYTAPQH